MAIALKHIVIATAVIIVLIVAIYMVRHAEAPVTAVPTPMVSSASSKAVLSRRADIRDWGYNDGYAGWFDVQKQGACNDYCRNVGDSPNVFFACALAGQDGGDEYVKQDKGLVGPMCEQTNKFGIGGVAGAPVARKL